MRKGTERAQAKQSLGNSLFHKAGAAFLALILFFSMGVLTSFAHFNHQDVGSEKANYLNSLPVTPATDLPDPSTQTEADAQVTDSQLPATHSYQVHYLIGRDGEVKQAQQPYRATVGAADQLSDSEKEKVSKRIPLPVIGGYAAPEKDFLLDYETVRNNRVKNYLYQPHEAQLKVHHVFQSLKKIDDFQTIPKKETVQNARVGEVVNVAALPAAEHPGFRAEQNVIRTKVPGNVDDFFVEYRYLRNTYQVKYDTAGGSFIPGKQLLYGQDIPAVPAPTKFGSEFLGWQIDTDLAQISDDNTVGSKIYTKDETTKQSTFPAAMPAKDITFTAQWKDKEKADYTVLVFAEYADYPKGADPLYSGAPKQYSYIGANIVKDAASGSSPNPVDDSIAGITFPDYPLEATAKVTKEKLDKERFGKYFKVNAEKTQQANLDANTGAQKTVLSTGETVYRVYYDRQVYNLVWEKMNTDRNTLDPTITKNGKTYKAGENPYQTKARFGQWLDDLWPRDYEITNWGKERNSLGWKINTRRKNGSESSVYRDTTPYRLTLEDFFEAADIQTKGHTFWKESPSRKGVKYDEFTISMGISQSNKRNWRPVHVDFQLQGFDGKYHYDPEMFYWKSDTTFKAYSYPAPKLKGFSAIHDSSSPYSKIQNGVVKSVAETMHDAAELNAKNSARPENEKSPFEFQKTVNELDFSNNNGYVSFRYDRDKYRLQLNNDPRKIKEDKDYSTESGDALDVWFDYPLKDLDFVKTKTPEKPSDLPKESVFLGWYEDPAGTLPLKYSAEKMPNYTKTVYAKWGAPRVKHVVTFDPNGGIFAEISASDLASCASQLPQCTADDEPNCCLHPEKLETVGDKQKFSVLDDEKIQNPALKPSRENYDFYGWEIVRSKNGVEDKEYRTTYGVPEFYAFTNPVTEDLTLRAVWVANDLVDLTVEHHYLESNGSERVEKTTIPKQRVGNYASAVSVQNDRWVLRDEPQFLETLTHPGKNANVQYLRVRSTAEIAKLPEVPTKDNPVAKADANVFKYYYRPVRQREYQVNYLAGTAKEKDKYKLIGAPGVPQTAGKPTQAPVAIIPQEKVVNGNRDYDARNFRPIPGWKLLTRPQLQLVFDLDAKNQLLGINGVRGAHSDEVNFYYSDIRIIQRHNPAAPTPTGYHRITFQAGEGGNFGTDPRGKPITTLSYDVIDGLDFDQIPVPVTEKSGGTPHAAVITPERGYRFTEWQNNPAAQAGTQVKQRDTFTVNFAPIADVVEIVDGSEAYPAKFVEVRIEPTAQAVENGNEKSRRFMVNPDKAVRLEVTAPTGKTQQVELRDAQGRPVGSHKVTYHFTHWAIVSETTADATGTPQVTQLQPAQEIDLSQAQQFTKQSTLIQAQYKRSIPAVAMHTLSAQPLTVPESLNGVNDFVPSVDELKAQLQSLPENAQIELREYDKFVQSLQENGKPDTEEQSRKTSIQIVVTTENGVKTIVTIPVTVQKNVYTALANGERPAYVPADYVPVKINPTEVNQDSQARVYYVNPKAKVLLSLPEISPRDDAKFTGWVIEPQAEVDDTANNPAENGADNPADSDADNGAENGTGNADSDNQLQKFDGTQRQQFTQATQITATFAKHGTSVVQQQSGVKVIEATVGTPIEALDYTSGIVPPAGMQITDVALIPSGLPNLAEAGKTSAKVRVTYSDGSVHELEIPIVVHANVIPALPNGSAPQGTPAGYVKVTLDPTEKAKDRQKQIFYVNPKVVVSIPAVDPQGGSQEISGVPTEFEFTGWNQPLVGQFTGETVIVAEYAEQIPGMVIIPLPKVEPNGVTTEVGKEPSLEEYQKVIPNWEPTWKLELITAPDVRQEGFSKAKVKITFANGGSATVDILVFAKEKCPACELPQPPAPAEPSEPGKPEQPSKPADPAAPQPSDPAVPAPAAPAEPAPTPAPAPTDPAQNTPDMVVNPVPPSKEKSVPQQQSQSQLQSQPQPQTPQLAVTGASIWLVILLASIALLGGLRLRKKGAAKR